MDSLADAFRSVVVQAIYKLFGLWENILLIVGEELDDLVGFVGSVSHNSDLNVSKFLFDMLDLVVHRWVEWLEVGCEKVQNVGDGCGGILVGLLVCLNVSEVKRFGISPVVDNLVECMPSINRVTSELESLLGLGHAFDDRLDPVAGWHGVLDLLDGISESCSDTTKVLRLEALLGLNNIAGYISSVDNEVVRDAVDVEFLVEEGSNLCKLSADNGAGLGD